MDKLNKGTKIRINFISNWINNDGEIERSSYTTTREPFTTSLEDDIPLLSDYSNTDVRLTYGFKGAKYISAKISNIQFTKNTEITCSNKNTKGDIDLSKEMCCIETYDGIKYYFEIL